MEHDEACTWECSKCGATPVFTRRRDWGYNMADAVCPTDGCHGGVYRPREEATR